MTSMSLTANGSATLGAWETAARYFGAIDPASPKIASPVAAEGAPAASKPAPPSLGGGEIVNTWAK
jgi:hypothetical protein